jgi:hypothetical protein
MQNDDTGIVYDTILMCGMIKFFFLKSSKKICFCRWKVREEEECEVRERDAK